MQDAEEWATHKNLTFQDREFLAASRNLVIEEENKKAQLERERQDKEAELERERQAKEKLEEANRKVQRRIRIGSIVLGITLLGAGISTIFGLSQVQEAIEAKNEVEVAREQTEEADKQLQEVKDQLNKANKNAEAANQRFKEAQELERKAQKQTETAEKQKQEADKDAKQAKKALNEARTEQASLVDEVQELGIKAQEAEKLERQAEQELEEALQAKLEAENAVEQAQDSLEKTNQTLEAVRDLSVLAGELRIGGSVEASEEALRKAGLSTLIANEKLKKIFLLAASAEASHFLVRKGREGVINEVKKEQILNNLKISLDSLNDSKSRAQLEPRILNQVKAFAYFQISKFEGEEHHLNAYNALIASGFDPFKPKKEIDILDENDVKNIHWELIKSHNININSETNPIAISFRKYLYDGLKFLLQEENLKEANEKTFEIMLFISGRKKENKNDLTFKSLEHFNCQALKEIDSIWVNYPKPGTGHFGFSVQKEIWQNNGSPDFDSPKKVWRQFYTDVGWRDGKWGIELLNNQSYYLNRKGYTNKLNSNKGNLPDISTWLFVERFWSSSYTEDEIEESILMGAKAFFSGTESCNL